MNPCCSSSNKCCASATNEFDIYQSETTANGSEIQSQMVQDYYTELTKGQGTAALKTSSCCLKAAVPRQLRGLMGQIHEEVSSKFYGCGSPIPLALEGLTVLDLGCGTGRDCFMLSKLVGASGRVIGVDMTETQLEVARKYVPFHTSLWGYETPNVEFKRGFIENLEGLTGGGLSDNSVDLIISNCVINLSSNKEQVFREIFRVLKPGGELFFSDVFSDRRVPLPLLQDKVLLGECLSGAMYTGDFERLMTGLFGAVYVCNKSEHELGDPSVNEIARKLGMIHFYSLTVRAFKVASLEPPPCEDYGEVAYYLGSLPESPHSFELSAQLIFNTQQPVRVCGNVASILLTTRYRRHFKVLGERAVHFGRFPNCCCSSVKL